MKLYTKTIFILFLLTFTLNASEALDKVYTFIGIQGAYTKYDNIDAPTIGFKYGKQNSEWRTAIIYNYAIKSDDSFHSIIIQVDRGVLTDIFRDTPLKPYLGFSFGAMQHRNNLVKDRGYLFGGNVGFNYVLNNYFDVDFGYKYMITSKFKHLNNRGDLALSLHYYFD